MSSKLGTLTLDLVARIGQFVEPIIKAEKVAADSAESITKKFNATTLAVQAFGAVVAGVSVAGVVEFAKVYIDSATEIDRGAKLIGSSIEQIQYYAAGAKVAGVNLEKFVDINKDVNDRLGEARRGEGEMMDFFTKIAPRVGITIDQFKKLSGPEVLQLYYNGLQKANLSHAEQITYMEQIANDASLLIPVLKDGGKGFEEWGEQAQKAGAIMSEDMVKQLVHAQENIQILDLKWQGVKATVVNDVMPAFSYVSENLEEIQDIAVLLGAALFGRVAGGFAVSTAATIANTVASQRKIIADYEIAKAELAATAAMVRSIGTINAETAAMMANARAAYLKASALKEATVAGLTFSRVGAGLLGVLGGPVGLATTALAVGASFLMMRDSSDEVKPSLDSQKLSIEELLVSYEKLNESAKRTQVRAESAKLSELSQSYDDARSKLISLTVALGRFDGSSNDAVKTANTLAMQYKQGDLTAEQFAQKINALAGISEESKSKIDAQASAIAKANTEMQDQQKVVDSLNDQNVKLAKAHDQITTSVNAQSKAYENLSQKQRDALKNIDNALQREKYIREFVQAGGTKEKAESFADYRDAADLGYGKKPLSALEVSQVNQGFAQKNYTFTKADLAAIAKVNGIASKNNFAQIEALYGLPKGTLAALVLGESGGNAGAISPTGAKGLFQTTGVFRKEYGLTSKSSIEDQAIAAAKDLAKNVQAFGGLEKALMAYNAGAGGTRQYLAGNIGSGKNQMSPSKAKEVAGYVPKFAKYFAGVNGKTSVDESILMPSQAELLEQTLSVVDAQKALDDKRKEVDSKYYTDAQQLAQDHQDRLEKITQSYGGTSQLAEMIAKENNLYASQSAELEANKKAEYQSYFDFETDRMTQITQNYDKEKALIQASTGYNKAQKMQITDALERQKQAEIEAIQRDEEQQVQSAFAVYMNETEIILNRYKVERDEILKNYQLSKETREKLLQANQMAVGGVLNQASDNVYQSQRKSAEYLMQKNTPMAYAQYALQNEYSTDSGSLFSSHQDEVSGINQIQDEEVRGAKLNQAHERYLQARQALNEEYADKEKSLHASQLQMNLSYGEQIFGSMTEMLDAAGRKQSGLYKAMFATQKAFSIASSMVAIQLGIAEAAANPFPYNLAAMATVAAATVSIISNIASIGFASGGYTGDGGKYDIAGVVHKGEGVLNQEEIAALGGAQGFAYLRRSIAAGELFNNSEILVSSALFGLDGYSDGGLVGNSNLLTKPSFNASTQLANMVVQPQIHINVPQGFTAEQNIDEKGTVTIDIVKQEVAKSWDNVRRSNSNESQAIQGAFGLSPAR